MDKQFLTIFKPSIARYLLKQGFFIVDIKPDFNDPSKNKTIFLFKKSEEIYKAIENYKLGKDESKVEYEKENGISSTD